MAKSVLNKNGVLLTILWSVSLVYALIHLAFGWFDRYILLVSDISWLITQLTYIGVTSIFAVMKGSLTKGSGKICAWAFVALHSLYILSWLVGRFLGIEMFAFMGIYYGIITSVIHSILFVWLILVLDTTVSVKVTSVINVVIVLFSAIFSVMQQYIWIHGSGFGSPVSKVLNLLIVIDNYVYALSLIVALIFAVISINKTSNRAKIPYRTVN